MKRSDRKNVKMNTIIVRLSLNQEQKQGKDWWPAAVRKYRGNSETDRIDALVRQGRIR